VDPRNRASTLSQLDFELVDRFQRDLPLMSRPYAEMGEQLGVSEWTVIAQLARLRSAELVSRVGAVFRPHSIGCSTLAALAAPPADLDRVAALVNAYPAVNHNYEREHRFNLWFVVAAGNAEAVEAVLLDIEQRTGLGVLRLPLVRDFHIDLGFPLGGVRPAAPRPMDALQTLHPAPLGDADRRLVRVLEPGLPLVSRPYRELGLQVHQPESEVIESLRRWLATGVIRRLGVVVRHHELGYRANGMVVWDLPDNEVDAAGWRLARFPWVTLCYRRPRRLPYWRYNLFTMIHGQDRHTVLGQLEHMARETGLVAAPREALFSLRRFKQRGARYGLSGSARAIQPVKRHPARAGDFVRA
jgi:DNA-binding Lrp family transcriptional regulator